MTKFLKHYLLRDVGIATTVPALARLIVDERIAQNKAKQNARDVDARNVGNQLNEIFRYDKPVPPGLAAEIVFLIDRSLSAYRESGREYGEISGVSARFTRLVQTHNRLQPGLKSRSRGAGKNDLLPQFRSEVETSASILCFVPSCELIHQLGPPVILPEVIDANFGSSTWGRYGPISYLVSSFEDAVTINQNVIEFLVTGGMGADANAEERKSMAIKHAEGRCRFDLWPNVTLPSREYVTSVHGAITEVSRRLYELGSIARLTTELLSNFPIIELDVAGDISQYLQIGSAEDTLIKVPPQYRFGEFGLIGTFKRAEAIYWSSVAAEAVSRAWFTLTGIPISERDISTTAKTLDPHAKIIPHRKLLRDIVDFVGTTHAASNGYPETIDTGGQILVFSKLPRRSHWDQLDS